MFNLYEKIAVELKVDTRTHEGRFVKKALFGCFGYSRVSTSTQRQPILQHPPAKHLFNRFWLKRLIIRYKTTENDFFKPINRT